MNETELVSREGLSNWTALRFVGSTAVFAYASLLPSLPQKTTSDQQLDPNVPAEARERALGYITRSSVDSSSWFSCQTTTPFSWEDESNFPAMPGDIQPSPSRRNPLRINDERITLLARKYSNRELSAEERARLEIVSERMKRFAPLVTERELEALADIANGLEEIDRTIADTKEQFGA